MNVVGREQVGEKLPKGWKWVKLGDVCTIQNGYAFKSSTFTKQGVPLIKMGNLSKDCRLRWKPELLSYLPETYLDLHSGFVVEKDDLLITLTDMSPSGEYLGTVALYDQNAPALLNQRVGRFISTCSELDIRYLYFRLCTKDFKRYATCDDTGNLQKNTNPEYLHKYRFILPPLPEQKRIVDILTDRLSTIDKARTATEAQLEAAKALPAAYLREVFDRPEARKWKRRKLGKLTTVVRGSSPRPQGDSRYYGGNVPRLMVADVTRDGMYIEPKIDFLTQEGAKLSRPMKQDDVVMVVSGAPGLPGILAVDACIHDGFVGFRDLDVRTLKNSFLFYYLKFINTVTDAQASGAIFRNLTTDQIKEFDIAVPNLETQELTVSILNRKIAQSRYLQQSLQSQLDTVNKLSAALLRQALNGEL